MTYLKQHRKGTLEVEGRKLTGNFEVSLTNQGDREMITEFISEIRKQLLKFNPTKKKKKKIKRRR
jgi:nitrogenase subunit NifH